MCGKRGLCVLMTAGAWVQQQQHAGHTRVTLGMQA